MRRVGVSFAVAACWVLCSLAPAGAEDSLPQNGKIAFIRSLQREQSGTYYIYTVNSDGSSLSRLTNGNPQFPNLLAWSPDGTQIAFNDSRGHILVMGADGTNLRTLTPNKRYIHNARPSWLPDGKRLAFAHNVSEYELNDIYTVDLDGSNITNITNTPKLWEEEVDVSPDGSRMCLRRYPEGRLREGIYVMNVDASNPTRLTDDNGSGCAWSPDGTKIAYTYRQETRGPEYEMASPDVYVMNADGSGKTNLTKSPKVSEGSPSWSPDGTKIAFSSDRDRPGDDSDIYTMDADGSNVAQVTTNPGAYDGSPDWQPLTPKSRSETVHQPDTGGPSLLLVASALLFSGGVMFYAGLKRRM